MSLHISLLPKNIRTEPFIFTGLIKGISDFYTNSNGYLSHSLFDELGFNSFSVIKDYSKTCNYILKYITKDCVKNEKGTIYISSRGLKKADKYEIKPLDIDWTFENDFCQVRDYQISQMTEKELLSFMSIN
ncbi:MAG: hypothetical protein HFJ25_03840 [Clostridia bacterium]|nr:hypothetical protein [Clostridia bacterium]